MYAAAAKSLQSCPTLCDPIDGSPPGSSVPGILQARTLEWVAISFSNAWKWKVKVKSLSRVWLLVTPWTTAHQAPPSMGFFRQEYWSGVPLPSLVYMYRYIIICKTTRWSGYFPHFKVRKSRAQDVKNHVPGHTQEVKPGLNQAVWLLTMSLSPSHINKLILGKSTSVGISVLYNIEIGLDKEVKLNYF